MGNNEINHSIFFNALNLQWMEDLKRLQIISLGYIWSLVLGHHKFLGTKNVSHVFALQCSVQPFRGVAITVCSTVVKSTQDFRVPNPSLAYTGNHHILKWISPKTLMDSLEVEPITPPLAAAFVSMILEQATFLVQRSTSNQQVAANSKGARNSN